VLELIREIPEFRDHVSQQALFESAVEPVKAVESNLAPALLPLGLQPRWTLKLRLEAMTWLLQPGLRQKVKHHLEPSFRSLRAGTMQLQNEKEDHGANSTWAPCCRNCGPCERESCDATSVSCICDGGMRLQNE